MTTKQTLNMILAKIDNGPMVLREAPVGPKIRTPEDAAAVIEQYAKSAQEHFFAILVDVKNNLILMPAPITTGILDASLVHPREVFREAVKHSAAAIVLAHNHPSGDPSPSAEDIRITRQLIDAGRIMHIRILDHVIVAAGNKSLSMRESGLLDFS